jgi:glycosyltransferase involved in cell wall biosynthesis
MAIDIMNRLTQGAERSLQLLCCGHIYDQAYYGRLLQSVETSGLTSRVKLLGPLSKVELRALFRQALATFSLYDLSNLGNVFIEAVSEGAVVITRKDGTTDFMIKHGQTGFQIETADEAVAVIRELMADATGRAAISARVRALADKLFESWEMRATREIELIELAVAQRAQPRCKGTIER